jgi:hypothetical protein
MADLELGSHTAASLQQRQAPGVVFDNRLRSLSIPSGYMVTLYSDDNFLGQNYTFTAPIPCLGAYGFNDMTSSLIISLGMLTSCTLVLYLHMGVLMAWACACVCTRVCVCVCMCGCVCVCSCLRA